jgi:hypothetical protein
MHRRRPQYHAGSDERQADDGNDDVEHQVDQCRGVSLNIVAPRMAGRPSTLCPAHPATMADDREMVKRCRHGSYSQRTRSVNAASSVLALRMSSSALTKRPTLVRALGILESDVKISPA